ncbi:putative alpha-aspartyl dipeptidase [Papilio machaon]|uniref:dipeptidase E n=1 Tax=Papilio machaon TaxID=76193 RepID=A0A194R433_PAPMA|nr:putative alpha-aspartyl dipeptidase [Papilio machaon]
MFQCQALLLSSSNCHGYSMLEFAKEEICNLLEKNNIENLLFVPYAQKNYDEYTKKIKEVIDSWGFSVSGLHTYAEPMEAINNAQAIFIGGGNTFMLLNTLYSYNLVSVIRERVLEGKLVYIGSSAGTNVATKSIHTTNDMPIIYPPSFEAIGLVPFNINPHYIDKSENETHKGETRDQRIGEYLEMPHAKSVLGLKEGSMLHVDGDSLVLKGVAGAVLFQKGGKKTEYFVGDNISFLLEE